MIYLNFKNRVVKSRPNIRHLLNSNKKNFKCRMMEYPKITNLIHSKLYIINRRQEFQLV